MKIRRYQKGDEIGIFKLDRMTEEHPWNRRNLKNWFWKYKGNNPAGRSLVWVAEINQKIVGTFSIIPMNYKIGIVLVTCVPSAITSSYLVKFIKGNIYLSVVMTAISSLMSFITIPLILTKVAPALGIGSETLASVDFKRLSVFLFLMATIPILIGSSVASKFHQFTKKVLPFFSKSAFLIFVFFILLVIYTDWDLAIEAFGELGWMLLILICTLLICANIIVNLFSIKKDDSKTIINEVLFQNGAMAIIIGSTI